MPQNHNPQLYRPENLRCQTEILLTEINMGTYERAKLAQSLRQVVPLSAGTEIYFFDITSGHSTTGSKAVGA
jgi:hypothetical protein